MKKYECIKSFYIDNCDGNEITDENDGVVVEKGTIWYDQEEDYREVGGEVRLENEDDTAWIEISEEDVVKRFEEIV